MFAVEFYDASGKRVSAAPAQTRTKARSLAIRTANRILRENSGIVVEQYAYDAWQVYDKGTQESRGSFAVREA